MNKDHCPNQNHSNMKVAVRFCATCGEIVNRNVPTRSCDSEQHAKILKSGSQFCVNCGKNVRAKH